MDGLSSASAAFAVVSVAVQLVETVQKLHAFWRTIQDAPRDVRELFGELSSLYDLLSQIRDRSHDLNPLSGQVLKDCCDKILRLQLELQRPLSDFKSSKYQKRKWGSLKVTLRKPFIESILASIEKTKSTLLLSRMYSLETHLLDIKNQNDALLTLSRLSNLQATSTFVQEISTENKTDMQLEECVEYVPGETQALPSGSSQAPDFRLPSRFPTQAILISQDKRHCVKHQPKLAPECHIGGPEPTPSPPISNSRLIVVEKHDVVSSSRINIPTLWTIHSDSRIVTKKRSQQTNGLTERNASYVLNPNKLLRVMGMSYGISIETKSVAGWQFTIRPFNVVPSNSPIFEFCKEGNVAAVRTLLNGGHASLRDRDQKGRTPLWVAARHLQLETSKFLLEQGADAQVYDWESHCPPILAVRDSTGIDVFQKMEVVDLISKYSPDGYHEDTITHLIARLLMFYRPFKDMKELSQRERREAAVMVLKQLLPHIPPGNIGWTQVIDVAIDFNFDQTVLHWALQNLHGFLHITPELSVLHRGIASKLLGRDQLSMELIVEKTPDLHLVHSPSLTIVIPRSSPTSLAMYQPAMFIAWQQLILNSGHDLDDFVQKELASGILLEDGWTQETLTALFSHHFEPWPSPKFRFLDCERCGKYEGPTMIDLTWRRRLRDIRLYSNSSTIPETVSSIKQHISIYFGTESANEYFEEISSDSDIAKPLPLPYNIVCSNSCYDGVCVARAFDNQEDDEPEFPLFGVKPVEIQVASTGDEVSDRKMPGSFID